MTPENYLMQFHKFTAWDPALGLSASFDITNYISGTPEEGRTEYNKIGGLIAGRYFGSKLFSVSDLANRPQPWQIKGAPGIDPAEWWTIGALRRAFGGRASPEELNDALRLAILVGRCKPADAAAYGSRHFGLDCNAFVGNYLGVSPSTAIFAYALGYGSGTPAGATADVLVTKDMVKVPPVPSAAKIRQGDIIATFSTKGGTSNTNWRHIGLVQACTPVAGGKYKVDIVEWGVGGTASVHKDSITFTPTAEKKLPDIAEELLPGKTTVSIRTTWGKSNAAALRVFLDTSSLRVLGERGWDVGGHYGT
jgi:hypothetical protein